MFSTTIRRVLIAGVAAPALVLGLPAVAMADSFSSSETQVGPGGASSHSVTSTVDGDGGVSFNENHSHAGPDGAGSSNTSSSAGGDEGLLGGLLGGIL